MNHTGILPDIDTDDMETDLDLFDHYQYAAVDLAVYPEYEWQYYLPMQLAAEAGEVAGKFAKAIRKDEHVLDLYPAEMIAKELGDVLWYVANLADAIGYDLSDIARMNIEKLTDRAERNTIHGDGDNR